MGSLKTICIVDDSVAMRKSGEALIKGSGLEVVTASDGYEGMQVILQEMPDACLIDIEMPDLNGLQLTTILKTNPATCAIPIAILSSHSSEFDKQRGLLAGADFYLTKPFSKDTINHAISQFRELLSDD